MARLKMTGLEAGHNAIFDSFGTYAPPISAVQARTGTYSINISGSSRAAYWTIPERDELYCRYGLYPTGYVATATWAQLFNGAGAIHLSFGITAVGLIEVRLGAHNGAVIATGGIVLAVDAWYCVELHVVIHDTDGVVQVKVDGILDIDISGINTAGGAGAATIMKVGIGAAQAVNQYMKGYIDDIVVNDITGSYNTSWPGRGGIHYCLPADIGAYSEFTPSAGDNWQCVDERPPTEDTDYVESDTVDHRDLYALTDLIPVDGTISAVQWICRAKLADAGVGNILRLVRHDGSDYVSTDKPIDTSYRYVTDIMELAPDVTAWTVAKVNALQAGQKVS